MSQPMTDAERDKRVAEIREHCAGLAVTQDDYWVKFLLAERDRLQQELAASSLSFMTAEETIGKLEERVDSLKTELAKERERVEYLIESIKRNLG